MALISGRAAMMSTLTRSTNTLVERVRLQLVSQARVADLLDWRGTAQTCGLATGVLTRSTNTLVERVRLQLVLQARVADLRG